MPSGRLEKFASVRQKLLYEYARLGYAVRFEVLDSQHYGTPYAGMLFNGMGRLIDLDRTPAICPAHSRCSDEGVRHQRVYCKVYINITIANRKFDLSSDDRR